jgi:hypothetical protein
MFEEFHSSHDSPKFSLFSRYKLKKMPLSTNEQEANTKSLLKIILMFGLGILAILLVAYVLNRGSGNGCTPSGHACTKSTDCCGDRTCNWGMCAAPLSSPTPAPRKRT